MMSLQEIHDYTLSQTTLDDVFIHFASQQSEEMGLCGPREERRISGPLPDLVAQSEGVSIEMEGYLFSVITSLSPSPSLSLTEC